MIRYVPSKLGCVGESHGLLWSLGIRAYACHSGHSGILDIWLIIILHPRMLVRAMDVSCVCVRVKFALRGLL